MQTYFVWCAETGSVKIGRSSRPQDRLRTLATSHAGELRLIGALDGDCEGEMHRRFASLRVASDREWFRADGELADFLRARFGAKLPHKRIRERAQVEPWQDVLSRAEGQLGVGLRSTEFRDFSTAAAESVFDIAGLRALDAADDDDTTTDDDEAFGLFAIIDLLEPRWPWVRGWNILGSRGSGYADWLFLFEWPKTERLQASLANTLAECGEVSEIGDALRLSASLAIARDAEFDLLGPVVIDDSALAYRDIYGTNALLAVAGLFGI